jgi:hypothetical protein
MAFTVDNLEEFIAILRQHPEWRQRVREEIIGEDMARIDARFERIEATLDRIAVDMGRVWTKLEDHDHRFDRVDERLEDHDIKLDTLTVKVDELTVKTDALTGKVDQLDSRMGRVEGKLGNLEGSDYERRFNAASRLAREYTRPHRVHLGDIARLAEARDNDILSDADWQQLASLDYLVRARRGKAADAPEVFIAFEVSKTVDANDVRRAAERAALIRRAGLEADAYAGGQVVTATAEALATELGVTLVITRTID